MFAKRVDIFKKKDRDAWESVKKALDEAGFKDYKAGHYLQESVMAAAGRSSTRGTSAGRGKSTGMSIT